MDRKSLLHLFWLMIIVSLVFTPINSPGQVQAATPEQPRSGVENEFTRFPPAPFLSTEETIEPSVENMRLPGSKVVFERYKTDNFEIYIANDDGSGATRLTYDPGADILPRLNRGGTKVAFTTSRNGKYDIYTINPDYTGLTRLTTSNKDDTNAVWSPDGTKLLFQSWRDGQSEIYVMDANGSNQTRLTNDPAYDGESAWSPDGSKIAWCAYRNGQNRIWVMNANGSGAVQLSQQVNSHDPTWSPDGTQIAYDADSNSDTWQEVWLMNADGTNQHLVYKPSATSQDALVSGWSPDGAWITYTHTYDILQNGNWYWIAAYLKIVSPTSSPATETDLMGTNLDWQPDWQAVNLNPPTSSVSPLPAISPRTFTVRWSGSNASSAGLKNYDIQVRDGAGGAWTDWLLSTTATSAVYSGIGGHTYYFRSRSRDIFLNLEAWPADSDALTMVENLPPVSAVNALPAYSPTKLTISWSGTDPGGSGVKSYDIQYKDISGSGTWMDWQVATTSTSAVFNGTSEHTYAFRSRAMDNALNLEAWPAGDQGDAKTILVSFSLQGMVTDNTGNPVVGATIDTNPVPFRGSPSGPDGSYSTFVTTGDSTASVNWSKGGYGSLPSTVFNVPSVGQLDVALTPADNVIANPTLEFTGDPLDPWVVGGVIAPMTSSSSHTGATSVMLGRPAGLDGTVDLSTPRRGIRNLPASGGSHLSQTVILPQEMTTPALSFFYKLGDATPANGMRFEVQVTQGADTYTLFSTTANTDGWIHQWFSLEQWAGKEITVTFYLYLYGGEYPGYALVDDVTIGSALPDVWVKTENTATGVPGATLQQTIVYGNQGSSPAQGVTLSVTLPDKLTFVSADLAPTSINGQTLTWDIGALAGKSGLFTIQITLTVAPDADLLSTLMFNTTIQTSTNEVETVNNTIQTYVFVGCKIYMPVITR